MKKRLWVFIVILVLVVLLMSVFSLALTPKVKKAEKKAVETGPPKPTDYGQTGIMVTSQQGAYLDEITGNWDYDPNKREFYGTDGQEGQTINVYDTGEIVHKNKVEKGDLFMFSDGKEEDPVRGLTVRREGVNKYSFSGTINNQKRSGKGEMIKERVYSRTFLAGPDAGTTSFFEMKKEIVSVLTRDLEKALSGGAKITDVTAGGIKFELKDKYSGSTVKDSQTGMLKTTLVYVDDPATTDKDESLNSKVIWGTGVSQTEAQKKEGKVSGPDGKAYFIDKSKFDEATGTCKEKACFYESANDFAAGNPSYAFYLEQTPYGFGKVEESDFEKGNPTEREIEILSGPNEGARVTQDLDGKGRGAGNIESDTFYDKDGYPVYNTDYGEGIRELNSRTFTITGYVDNGVSVCEGCTSENWNQKSTQYLFSEDGEWVFPDENKNGRVDPDEIGKKINKDDVETKVFQHAEAIKEGLSDQYLGKFFAGETEWQKWGQSVLSQRGWNSLSTLFFGDLYAFEYARKIDQAFSVAVLSEDWYESKVCEDWVESPPKTPGESTAFIETPSGTYQPVASIQAEKTPESTVILCMGEDKICPLDYVCKDDFCYENEDAEEPAKGYFYKITWGVTAPQDEAFTPYVDENGIAVSFNIELSPGGFFIYAYDGQKIKKAIRLENGNSDNDAIVHYSPEEYDEVCIVWEQAPEDRWGGEVSDLCALIIESEEEKTEWEQSGKVSSSGSRRVSEGEVTRDMGW